MPIIILFLAGVFCTAGSVMIYKREKASYEFFGILTGSLMMFALSGLEGSGYFKILPEEQARFWFQAVLGSFMVLVCIDQIVKLIQQWDYSHLMAKGGNALIGFIFGYLGYTYLEKIFT
jgi:hypothetical protein